MDKSIPKTMSGVYLLRHGDFSALQFRQDIPVPEPGPNQVLIQVGGAGVNNTDINTRIGWYSKSIRSSTNDSEDDSQSTNTDDDGSWTGEPITFPRIQGADCAGRIVAVGRDVDSNRIGERVLVRTIIPIGAADERRCVTLGSELDGGFAEYMVMDTQHALSIDCDWSDIELASIPCAYSTAESMLQRATIGAETVLVTGASGGVGSAAVQLLLRRGARVIAQSSASKAESVRHLGADLVVDRNASLEDALGHSSVDVVVDLVAGPAWPSLLEILRPGGRYVTAGAIAGPIVELDVRTLYLKDLTLFGSTWQAPSVLEDLIRYIQQGEIKPLVAKSYPLSNIIQAQEDFIAKKFMGKLVLVP